HGTSRVWRRGGHSTGSCMWGIASSAWGLPVVSLLPAYLTPVGTCLHASHRIPARVPPTRGVKGNGVVGCTRLLLVAWPSSKLYGITPLCTPFLPEDLSGLDLITAKRRGALGPGCSALLALCPPLGAPGKTRTRAVGAISV